MENFTKCNIKFDNNELNKLINELNQVFDFGQNIFENMCILCYKFIIFVIKKHSERVKWGVPS